MTLGAANRIEKFGAFLGARSLRELCVARKSFPCDKLGIASRGPSRRAKQPPDLRAEALNSSQGSTRGRADGRSRTPKTLRHSEHLVSREEDPIPHT